MLSDFIDKTILLLLKSPSSFSPLSPPPSFIPYIPPLKNFVYINDNSQNRDNRNVNKDILFLSSHLLKVRWNTLSQNIILCN